MVATKSAAPGCELDVISFTQLGHSCGENQGKVSQCAGGLTEIIAAQNRRGPAGAKQRARQWLSFLSLLHKSASPPPLWTSANTTTRQISIAGAVKLRESSSRAGGFPFGLNVAQPSRLRVSAASRRQTVKRMQSKDNCPGAGTVSELVGETPELSEPAGVAETTVRLLSPPRADDTRRTTRIMPRMPRLGGIVAAIVAVIVLIVVLSAVHLLPQLRNPFAETTTVRSQPVILKSITNLSRYEAASGSFQVVVDLTKRSSIIPSFLEGSETLFIGQ